MTVLASMVRRIKKQGKTTKKKIAVKIANLVTSDGQRGTKKFSTSFRSFVRKILYPFFLPLFLGLFCFFFVVVVVVVFCFLSTRTLWLATIYRSFNTLVVIGGCRWCNSRLFLEKAS